MIKAEIICDSIAPNNCRLTTFVLEYPRYIHSELLTHRMFSKNSASSRAIPASKLIERVQNYPVVPIYWGKNQKGMQCGAELDEVQQSIAKGIWLEARDNAIKSSQKLAECGIHKSICNRLVEPFFYIKIVLSATDFGNFFNLRVHKDAEPSIIELSKLMLIEYEKSVPQFLDYGEWHLPFIKQEETRLDLSSKKIISTARCARTSYLNFEGLNSFEDDCRLHNDLMNNGHMSPFEHPATPSVDYDREKEDYRYHGNFKGWKQYRKFLANENRETFNSNELLEKINLKGIR